MKIIIGQGTVQKPHDEILDYNTNEPQMEIGMPRIIITLIFSCFSLVASANSESITSNQINFTQIKSNIEHSGRTDSNGCHRDRKTGTRHCH